MKNSFYYPVFAIVFSCITLISFSQDTYQEWLDKDESAFVNYNAKQKAAWLDFLKNVEHIWGADNVRLNTNAEWVAYDESYASRRRVDFEQGQATVEVVIDQSESDRKIQDQLASEIVRMIQDDGSDDVLSELMEEDGIEDEVLGGQLETPTGEAVTVDNAEDFAQSIVENQQIETETIEDGDGNDVLIASVSFPLVPDHIRRRAERFKDIIQAEAQRFNVDAQLVFAVTHTESWFNPIAKSSVAYGLMQLVPRSGALEAYRAVYKRDRIVDADYLYQPQKNVELGTAYLDVIMSRYFSRVTDDQSRLYCAIASYNTGPGNVARAFTGDTKLGAAATRINQMTSDQVFEHLKAHLPYEETRHYIVNVTERMPLYHEWKIR